MLYPLSRPPSHISGWNLDGGSRGVYTVLSLKDDVFVGRLLLQIRGKKCLCVMNHEVSVCFVLLLLLFFFVVVVVAMMST